MDKLLFLALLVGFILFPSFPARASKSNPTVEIQIEEIFSGEWIDPNDRQVFCSYETDLIERFRKTPIYINNKRILLGNIILMDYLPSNFSGEKEFLEKIVQVHQVHLDHIDSGYSKEDFSNEVNELLAIRQKVKNAAIGSEKSFFDRVDDSGLKKEFSASSKAGQMIYDVLCSVKR